MTTVLDRQSPDSVGMVVDRLVKRETAGKIRGLHEESALFALVDHPYD